MVMRSIRKAFMRDIDIIMRIYEEARVFMRSTGNGSQWGDSFPPRGIIAADIENGDLYVCTEKQQSGGQSAAEEIKEAEETKKIEKIEEIEETVGVFYFKVEEEPTYKRIDGGGWLNNEPYGVVHRMAGSRKAKGVAAFCLDWCEKQCANIRIDTHRDNIVMLKVLKKAGYTHCGVIYVANGSERLAFQKVSQKV